MLQQFCAEDEWTREGLEQVRDLIEVLLCPDPGARPTAAGLKSHAFFAPVDWKNILIAEPPFTPDKESETDTQYFQGRRGRLSPVLE